MGTSLSDRSRDLICHCPLLPVFHRRKGFQSWLGPVNYFFKWACQDGCVVLGIATDLSLSLINALVWMWPSLNPSHGMWESCQWLRVRRCFSPDTPLSSTPYNWLVTTYPQYCWKSDKNKKFWVFVTFVQGNQKTLATAGFLHSAL